MGGIPGALVSARLEGSGADAFLFPGQGSQKVGMGLDLAREHEVCRRTFEEEWGDGQ